ncbi:thiamine phosphate synthase [Paludifilum halophilum]|uniref:Thiamine phosphate synthase/TenI domain-containing protein n=1 Tax=Paludifilum halophilum TaxID=1642702 RepID=A0A235B7Y9_9BACL|nr:thiamine phosphate synthase [Paludifilum halophilum]OYD07705.1 hypothetical protein CHM34_09520 [Paludifilum halophilum]
MADGAPTLHLISGETHSLKDLIGVFRETMEWVDVFYLRKKGLAPEELIYWARSLLDEGGIPPERLMVNGDWEVAAAVGCAGVHLPETGPMPDVVRDEAKTRIKIGCSVHSVKTAQQRAADGADYLFYGHIFSTPSKPGKTPRGVKALTQLAEAVPVPVMAVGGIKAQNIHLLAGSGCDGVAVISEVMDAENPAVSAQKLKTAMRDGFR